ncbi:MAG: AbrB/MazE/SpoVT family DNA-binding domain-containing protein [Clostridia bacterium]|nr:AbrB/MazE/SpoVT family DNA-binding domain-containing protein [Clostridia bacterium]
MDFYFYRRIDKLGRIVIPKDIRDLLSIENNDVLSIRTTRDGILISKEAKKTEKREGRS